MKVGISKIQKGPTISHIHSGYGKKIVGGVILTLILSYIPNRVNPFSIGGVNLPTLSNILRPALFSTEPNLVTDILWIFQSPRQCKSKIMVPLVEVGISKIQNSRSVPYRMTKK